MTLKSPFTMALLVGSVYALVTFIALGLPFTPLEGRDVLGNHLWSAVGAAFVLGIAVVGIASWIGATSPRAARLLGPMSFAMLVGLPGIHLAHPLRGVVIWLLVSLLVGAVLAGVYAWLDGLTLQMRSNKRL